jgi:hypothetical protein
MIRRLRDRHRRIIPLLALLSAIALAVALFSRHSTTEEIPRALGPHREAQ